MLNRRCVAALLALPALLGTAGLAQAQAFPAKNIRWVVPYPAGGGSDFLARTIGQQLATQVNQTILVDNKPGGNTSIAAAEVDLLLAIDDSDRGRSPLAMQNFRTDPSFVFSN